MLVKTLLFLGLASTLSPLNVPSIDASNQWLVKIDEPKARVEINKLLPPYHMYSLLVENKGDFASNVTVDVYRSAANTKTKWNLMTIQNASLNQKGENFQHLNFPVLDSASEVEVNISWDDATNRRLKESFTFKKSK